MWNAVLGCYRSWLRHHYSHGNPMDCSLPDPLSVGFPRREYWSGLPCPPPGDLSHPGTEPASPVSCIRRQILYHSTTWESQLWTAAAAAAKSLQSCPTLCDPIDGSPPGSPVPGILQARALEWVAISFSKAWKWKVKVKSLSCARLCWRQESWWGLSVYPFICLKHIIKIQSSLSLVTRKLFFHPPNTPSCVCFIFRGRWHAHCTAVDILLLLWLHVYHDSQLKFLMESKLLSLAIELSTSWPHPVFLIFSPISWGPWMLDWALYSFHNELVNSGLSLCARNIFLLSHPQAREEIL